VPYRDYLRLEGWCSIVLGLEMALVAFPGLFVSWEGWPVALLFAPGVLVLLAGFGALRNGARPGRPGEWLTTRPLRGAKDGRPGLPAAALRRRLLVETAIWITGIVASGTEQWSRAPGARPEPELPRPGGRPHIGNV
jgi:hypothetical protein